MSRRPRPIDGDEFPVSRSRTLWLAAAAAIGALFCAAMLVAIVVNLLNGGSVERIVCIGFLIGPFVLAVAAFQFIRSVRVRRTLIIGDDRVQITEFHDGEVQVVVQIPFECLEDIRYKRVESFMHRIDFEFEDLRHQDLLVPDENMERNFIHWGYHHAVTDHFDEESERLVRLMRSRLQKWRRQPCKRPPTLSRLRAGRAARAGFSRLMRRS